MKKIRNARVLNSINIFLNKFFNLTVIGIVVIMLIFGYLFIIRPKYNEIAFEIKLAGEEKSMEYLERHKYFSQLRKLKDEYQKINQKDIDNLNILLPEKNNVEELLAHIEGMILKNGFLLSSLDIADQGEGDKTNQNSNKPAAAGDFAEEKISGKVKKVEVSMNIIGADYEGLKRLLAVIENNLRLMDIVSLSYNLDESSASIVLYTYYLDNN